VGGLILVALGLVPKLGAVIASIPLPVLGGAGLALCGTVAASGIRALSRVNYDGTSNLVIVAVSIGMGVIPIAVPTFYEHFPTWFQTIFDSGISAAAIFAILLNLLFNGTGRTAGEAPLAAESPTPGVTPEYDVPGGVDRGAQSTQEPPAH
jgi:uric acid transporter